MDRASYAIGLAIGKHYREEGVELSLPNLIQGITDGLVGHEQLLTDAEINKALEELAATLRTKRDEKIQKLAAENLRAGTAFLAENAKKEGVVVTSSGLQYKVIKQGDGTKPRLSSRVIVHYRGTLVDGTEFDSSYGRQEPLKTVVGRTIKGWSEALPMMPVGSKWMLYIPADLAYGEEGGGDQIPPNSTLVFEIELLGIE